MDPFRLTLTAPSSHSDMGVSQPRHIRPNTSSLLSNSILATSLDSCNISSPTQLFYNGIGQFRSKYVPFTALRISLVPFSRILTSSWQDHILWGNLPPVLPISPNRCGFLHLDVVVHLRLHRNHVTPSRLRLTIDFTPCYLAVIYYEAFQSPVAFVSEPSLAWYTTRMIYSTKIVSSG